MPATPTGPVAERSRFSTAETEAFYDAEDAFYRSFWDAEGSLHWGVFDESTGSDFRRACGNLNLMMAEKARLDDSSEVLDLGCGNGVVAAWLARTFECQVTGIDLSGVRVANAQQMLRQQPAGVRGRLSFAKASANDLPYDDAAFSHVWSQAVVYHVHEKEEALQQVHRVLEPGGRFVFDDLIKPKPEISLEARTHVYDRLLFDTDFSFGSYQTALADTGFDVLEAHDLSAHLKRSYECLIEIAGERRAGADGEHFGALSLAYGKMVDAIDRDELGWGLYVCEKR